MTDTDKTRQLPPAPEGMNDNRAALAGEALDAFIIASGADEEDAVGDLLVGLMHWCDRNNYDFELALDRALSHYEAETSSKQASMTTPSPIPTETPWGKPDTISEIAPGIIRYDTPSHGGYWLSPERVAEMPKCLREFKPWAGPNFYEEDCDWSVVALAFPQYFPDDAIFAALTTVKHYKPELFAELVKDIDLPTGTWQRKLTEEDRARAKRVAGLG